MRDNFLINDIGDAQFYCKLKYANLVERNLIDLVTVFDAILTSRQTHEKLQCLYENLMSDNFRTGGCSQKIRIVNKTSLPRNLLKQIESVIWARRPSVKGGGIFSGTTQYFKMGREEEGSQAFLTQPPLVLFAMRFDGYPFAALRP